MHIAVLIKQVLDPDLPARAFRVDRARLAPDVARPAMVPGIFDGNALEVALKLRESLGGGKITALSLGPAAAVEVLRKALALTADAAVLISDPAFETLDSGGKADVFAAAVRRLGDVDLVLCGRQAADWENGQVGAMLAEALGWPCVPFASRIGAQGSRLRLRREADDGFWLVEAEPPLVATITNDDTNVLRSARVRDVMASARKVIPTWSAADLRLDPAALGANPAVETLDLFVPERRSECERVPGDTAAERARALARRLRELNLV